MCEEDEQKNERFKSEYKNYQYQKTFGTSFNVYVRSGESYTTTDCPDYNSLLTMAQSNQLTNVKSLKISLSLTYKRGNYTNFEEHTNEFNIEFKPYDIKFTRKANHRENNMEQIETAIVNYFNNVERTNTIFCSK